MSFNNSTSFEDVLNTVGTAINLILFIVVVPITILYGICIMALLFSKGINYQMRVLLINIFIAHLSGILFPRTITHLGFPANIIVDDLVCKIFFDLVFTGHMITLTSITLFSIMVYLFIKYGKDKLKWYVIIPSIALSWIISVLYGALIFIDPKSVYLGEGFCTVDSRTIMFIFFLICFWGTELVCSSIMVIFSILTVYFIRRHTLHDTTNDTSQRNPKIKKAITKVLVYLVIGSFMNFFSNLIPSLLPLIYSHVDPKVSTILSLLIQVLSTVSPVLTPIVMISILKPVRDALKQIKGKMFFFS